MVVLRGERMRRKDKEIVNNKKIEEIIKASHCCRIGFNDSGEVYIVPLNFGYKIVDDQYIFYFHGAKKGRKMDLIKQNPKVGFELDTKYTLTPAEEAYDYSAEYQSVIGTGIISLIEGIDAKKEALLEIMKHNTGKEEWTFPEKILEATAVFKVEVKKLSAKGLA